MLTLGQSNTLKPCILCMTYVLLFTREKIGFVPPKNLGLKIPFHWAQSSQWLHDWHLLSQLSNGLRGTADWLILPRALTEPEQNSIDRQLDRTLLIPREMPSGNERFLQTAIEKWWQNTNQLYEATFWFTLDLLRFIVINWNWSKDTLGFDSFFFLPTALICLYAWFCKAYLWVSFVHACHLKSS